MQVTSAVIIAAVISGFCFNVIYLTKGTKCEDILRVNMKKTRKNPKLSGAGVNVGVL